jgi:hypothetical protein
MISLMRNALLGSAGLLLLSLPAHAVSSTVVAHTPLFNSTTTTKSVLLAQRPYDPSAGSVGFRNENPGGVGFKKSKKAKKKKK